MIDIHCHILPYIDDGAKNMKEAIEMAKIAYEEGIAKIIATPHYIEDNGYPSQHVISQIMEELQIAIKSEGIEVEIFRGSEAYLTYNLPLLITNRKIPTINNTKYLLIELPMLNMPIYIDDVIYKLKLMNITPIIAHPERYRYVMKNPNLLIKYIDMGALCQINSGSIIGKFGKDIMKTAKTLIYHDMVHFVASDGHSSSIREPRLKNAYKKVIDLYGKEKSEELFNLNPQKIINGKELEIKRPQTIDKKNAVRQFLKKICINKIR